MKIKKLIFLGIIKASTINLIFFLFSKTAWSSECSFDSYIIMNGKCINLNQQLDSNTDAVHRTIYRDESKNKAREVEILPEKTCSDFQYQHDAQNYFDFHPEYKSQFDLDNDGYVCENLTRVYGNILTMKIWQTLLYKNRQRKIESNNDHALTFAQVNRVIGFQPNSKKERRRHVWEDPITQNRIEIRFFPHEITGEYEIKDMKGIGFSNR